MTSFISPSLFIFVFLSLVISDATTHSDIILKTCKQCSDSSPNVNYTLCVSSLQSVPKSHRSNLRGLGVISVELSITNAKQVRSKVKNLLKANPEDQFVKSSLETCLGLYTDAISGLMDSVKAIKSGHYDDANTWISSAVDAPGTCDDSFAEGNLNSPLVVEDKGFFQLAVISLGITALLQ